MASHGDDNPSARQLAQENRRLKRAVDELSVLNDLARAIGASLGSRDIMDKIIRRSLRAVGAEQGVISLVSKRPDDVIKTVARAMVTSSERQPLHIDQALLGWMYTNQRPLVINDVREDKRFSGLQFEGDISSILCVPMMVKSEVKGVLAVYNKKGGGGFTGEDERLLSIVAGQSAQVVENARLREEQQALSSLKEEVKLLSQIQIELLPKASPSVPGYDIAGKNVSARVVGGDYYDFISLDENRICVCVGDVSGKGLPASLLMANLQATLRGQAHRNVVPSTCLRRCNNMLFRSTNPEHFVTLFCGLLDSAKHHFTFCNAGHNYPLLFSGGGEPILLKTGGVVLGVIEDREFEQETVSLSPGDVLVIYSDGVTEAMDGAEIEFGEERLNELIESHLDDSAPALISRVFEAVNEHAGDYPQSDDMTMVVVKRTAD
jgi:sigma-B regulation protein RsbU (phosphoserine phosphatase)